MGDGVTLRHFLSATASAIPLSAAIVPVRGAVSLDELSSKPATGAGRRSTVFLRELS